jgi:hypothetical protein
MPTARLIVCERTGRWAAALVRELGSGGPQVVQVRSLAQCEAELTARAAAVAAVEVTPANLQAAVALFLRARVIPQVRLVALLAAELAGAEVLLREAGACDVLTSLLQAPGLARLAGRHCRMASSPTQPADMPMGEFHASLAERLPWPAYAAVRERP